MNTSHPDSKQLRSWCIIALIFWCILIAGLLSMFERREWQNAIAIGQEIGRFNLKKDYTYRSWNASHGGVYVPVTKRTPPSPYLSHIPDRDIITQQGKELTLLNPAYMTREVHELENKMYGIRGHITSLNVIRPANKADKWERIALEQFEQGAEEVS